MIYFFYGPDTYRSQKKLQTIISKYQEKNKESLDLKIFEEDNFDFNDLQTGFEQVSMFKEKKLIILKNVLNNKDFSEKFLSKKKNFLKTDNILVFHQNNDFSKRSAFYKFLRKKNSNQDFQEFKLLEKDNLRKWIKIQFHKIGGKISYSAINELINFVGDNLWQMESEIMKLNNFKKEEEVTVEDVRLLVKPKTETNIFKTIEAIANQDKKQALQLFQSHLEEGAQVPYILSMIAYQFRVLLIIKDLMKRGLSPFQDSGLHPFVIKKSRPLADKFTFSDLKKIYQKILEIDAGVKTGKIEPRTAIDLLIIEI